MSFVQTAPVPDSDRLLIGAQAAAKQLSISARTLWTLTDEGQVPFVRVGRRVLYSPTALKAWIDAGCPQSAAE
jgi:excisionase family DNA binding protein